MTNEAHRSIHVLNDFGDGKFRLTAVADRENGVALVEKDLGKPASNPLTSVRSFDPDKSWQTVE